MYNRFTVKNIEKIDKNKSTNKPRNLTALELDRTKRKNQEHFQVESRINHVVVLYLLYIIE